MTYRIKDWGEYQHYSKRNPPWIKLHKKLLDDPDFYALSGDASKTLALCWLVASENNGYLPAIDKLAFRLRIASNVLAEHLIELKHWIIDDASNMLADCKQDAIPETEAETEAQSIGEEKKQAEPSDSFFEKSFSLITKHFPDLTAKNSASIHQWQEAGYSFDKHIKPTVESVIARGVKPKSFSYFTEILSDMSAKKPPPARAVTHEPRKSNVVTL